MERDETENRSKEIGGGRGQRKNERVFEYASQETPKEILQQAAGSEPIRHGQQPLHQTPSDQAPNTKASLLDAH